MFNNDMIDVNVTKQYEIIWTSIPSIEKKDEKKKMKYVDL